MSALALRFLGVGSAMAPELGSSSAMLERDGAPLLMIDCGQEALSACLARYGAPPAALFLTHAHLDHIAGMERLFVEHWFGGDAARRGTARIYAAASLVPLLQQRVGEYPGGMLAEGGVNFWDAFQLVPHGAGFWHGGLWFDTFATRHHAPGSAHGLRLRNAFTYTGDTRPIPEILAPFAATGELIAHDCGLTGNPSHTGLDDLSREYPPGVRARLLLYHYGSEQDGGALAAAGYRVARSGEAYPLPEPDASVVVSDGGS